MRRRMAWVLTVLVMMLFPAACLAEYDGFTLEELTFPGVTLEGRTLVVPEGVTGMGFSWDDDPDVLQETLRIQGSFLTSPDDEGEWLPIYDMVRLPSTLKRLDQESLIFMEIIGDLLIPEGVEKMEMYCLYRTHVMGKLMLPSTLRSEPYLVQCSFGEVVISPDNPWYCTVEGVVFTKDMTELIWYPTCRKAVHYDVPKEVRIIRSNAFEGNSYLQTVSLPIGLTTIGSGAFTACGRLTAVNVPLTVTEIGSCAFADCVSLQLLTLPPALGALLVQSEMEDDEDDDTEWGGTEGSEYLPGMVFDNCPALGTFYGDNGRDMIE